jgi:prevent-host-death family protein
MRTIPAGQFKARCLALLNSVGPEGIVITKHGRPVAKLVPVDAEPRTLIGSLKGKLRLKGNLLSTGVRWNAQSRHARSAARARR